MTPRLFFAEALAENRAVVRGAEARHLTVVLRAKPGEEFDLAIGGRRFRAAVTRTNPEAVEFGAVRPLPETEFASQVTVLAAVIRFERFEWMIEKATELGAAAIQPVVAERTAPHLARAAGGRRERWERLSLAASQQARRAMPPVVLAAVGWRQAFAAQEQPGAAVLLSERAGAPPLAVLAREHRADCARLAIGPEGGWSDAEHAAALEAGFLPATLGRSILRAETAAIAALAVWVLA